METYPLQVMPVTRYFILGVNDGRHHFLPQEVVTGEDLFDCGVHTDDSEDLRLLEQ